MSFENSNDPELLITSCSDFEQGKKSQPRRAHVPAKWNWDVHRMRIVRLLATALQLDLRQLYSMAQPEDDLIAFFSKLVLPATLNLI